MIKLDFDASSWFKWILTWLLLNQPTAKRNQFAWSNNHISRERIAVQIRWRVYESRGPLLHRIATNNKRCVPNGNLLLLLLYSTELEMPTHRFRVSSVRVFASTNCNEYKCARKRFVGWIDSDNLSFFFSLVSPAKRSKSPIISRWIFNAYTQ